MTFIGRQEQPWRGLDPKTASAVLGQVNRHVAPRPMNAERTLVSWAPLSFYDDVLLYALRDDSTLPAITKYALRRRREIFVMDGTPVPILAANAAAPLKLSRETVVDYARFFTSHVWHYGLPHALVERMEEVPSAALMTEEQSLIVNQVIHPARVRTSPDIKDVFEVQACFVVDRRLVQRHLRILTDGRVQCAPDKVLVENLPPAMEQRMF